GTQAYMAMEKVLSVVGDPRYDLIVLDTPPTSDALDFLDAPERLIGAIDSAALGWLTQAFQKTGFFSLNVLAKGVSLVLRGLSRLTGQGFLEHLAAFVGDLNELFGGFRERAERVARAFRAPDFAYLLVATPSAEALGEAAFFAERLQRLGMRADALIVNRTRPKPSSAPVPEQIASRLRGHGSSASSDLVMRILRASGEESASFERERRAVDGARARASALSRERVPLCVEVPAFPESVHDVAALVSACRHLA
ncbi:MAG TPA: ArsA-related P-loop ATPase, partial [Polyangiaceae bacterium]|nr:ArsA-related P-loop ATPase [Polyangiaceae bacterium]